MSRLMRYGTLQVVRNVIELQQISRMLDSTKSNHGEDDMKITGRHLLVLVAMCGLIASTVGLVTNVAGLFLTPVAEEFGILKGSASLTMTICNISFAIGGLFVPRVMKEIQFKKVLIVCTAILAGCTAAMAMCPGIIPMYVLCVARGLAAGLMGFVFVTSVLNQWFVSGIGLATSIAMSCSGLAGAAFSPLVGAAISGAGWRAGYLLLGVLTVALNLPAILFLPSLDPTQSGFKALGADEQAAAAAGQQGSAATSAQKVSVLMLVMVFMFGVLISAPTALPQHFPGMAELYDVAAVGATMLSFTMVVNSLGKIVYGALSDRVGNRISLIIYSALVFASLFLMLTFHSSQALVIAAALYGLCYSLGTVCITMLTRDAFGPENYGKTYPIIGMGGNIANAVFSSVVGFMYDFSGGYTTTIILMMVLLGLSVAIALYVYGRKGAQA